MAEKMGFGIPDPNRSGAESVPVSNAVPSIGTITSAGATEIVAAPSAGDFIRVHYYTWICDPDSTSTPMVTLKASGGTAYHLSPATAKSWQWDLPEGEALELELSQSTDASGVGYTVFYTIESL